MQRWKNALLDLTLRTKLLNLRQPMTQVPLLLPPEHLGRLANQLQDGRTVSVRAVDDLTGAVVSEGSRDAYALRLALTLGRLLPRSHGEEPAEA